MQQGRLTVRGARQHNLKNLSIDIPRSALTVVTGPSGSGKSSLAFDTIYAEGQRRYVESVSSYAKQFLERMPKPDVDAIDGISPAVAIEQKNPATSSRSTIGTATEIYDYFRLLWARIGVSICGDCDEPIRPDTVQSATDAILAAGSGEIVTIAFPLPKEIDRSTIAAQLGALGFVRLIHGGRAVRIDDADDAVLHDPNLLVAVDRIRARASERGRLAEAISTGFAEGEGVAVAIYASTSQRFSEHAACSTCGRPAPVLTPSLFSFNSPYGACPGCNGFGSVLEYDESLIIPDPERSLTDGAIDPWTKPRYDGRRRILRDTARRKKIPLDRPWGQLPEADRHFLLHGKAGHFVGVFPFLTRLEGKRYKQYIRVFLRQYQLAARCPTCNGGRLKPEALAVRVGGQSIAGVAALSVSDAAAWLSALRLSESERSIADLLLRELTARIGFLLDVGLEYLTIDRETRSLSGGEAQRIALSNALGSYLVDTLYVLDEPSIGLHPRDTDRLLKLLRALADRGNTVMVVEHDPETMRHADHVVELGPGSGDDGGQLMYQGPLGQLAKANTLTASYLTGERLIAVPSHRRPLGRARLRVQGARLHNLHGIDVEIPLGMLVAVTGVSGSGKSTLVHDVVYRGLEERLAGRHTAKRHLGELVGGVDDLTGWETLSEAVLIDQTPIGRSPRSNPVTYLKAFDRLRMLYASQPLARARGYTAATFSFNVHGGRCDVCDGAGHIQVEMVFLADVYVPCEACRGTRYRSEVLDVTVDGLSIADALALSVKQAMLRFRRDGSLVKMLWYLDQVGLGYLRIGQPATTLSGGEAQRLKIARELARVGSKGGRRLYVLDEPTTGLHLDDVRVLCRVLDKLVDAGHSVIVIEHHLDVIKRADWVIDLGPEGGARGGDVVVTGRPEDVAHHDTSHTGRYLRSVLGVEAPAVA